MKTKGRVLGVAVVVLAVAIMFIVGSAGSGFAFGNWPYPGHYMSPELEKRQAVETAAAKATTTKKGEGAVKEDSGTEDKASDAKPAAETPVEK